MKKTLLTERFQELAGIKPLYENPVAQRGLSPESNEWLKDQINMYFDGGNELGTPGERGKFEITRIEQGDPKKYQDAQSAQKFLDELKMLGKVVVRFDDYIGDITVISDREGDAIVSWTNPVNEAANTNLELKSMAKQLYQHFKKAGAKVKLTDQNRWNKERTASMKVGDDDRVLDNIDVVIFIAEDGTNDAGTVGVDLIGDKAISFEDKIKNTFPQFQYREIGSRETWGGKEIKQLRISNKGERQFSTDKPGQIQQTTE